MSKITKSEVITAIKNEDYAQIRNIVENINFSEIKNLYDVASFYNKTDVLEFMFRIDLSFNDDTYTKDALKFASIHHHENVLAWWLKMCHNIELKYDHTIINDAACNGDIWILDWWHGSGLELVYTSDAIDDASINNKITVLDWWYSKRHILKFIYTNLAIDFANNEEVLTWWILRYGDTLKFNNILQNASNNSNVKILQCWEDAYTSGYLTNVKITKGKISKVNNVLILRWLMKSKLLDEKLKQEVQKTINKQIFENTYSQKFVNDFKVFKKYFNNMYFLQKANTQIQLTDYIVFNNKFQEKQKNNILELIDLLSKTYFFVHKDNLSKVSITHLKKNISKNISKK